jgi:hypothetical protein
MFQSSKFIQFDEENDDDEEEYNSDSQENFNMDDDAITASWTQVAMEQTLLIDTSTSSYENDVHINVPSNHSWESFLKDFTSASKYKKLSMTFSFGIKLFTNDSTNLNLLKKI